MATVSPTLDPRSAAPLLDVAGVRGRAEAGVRVFLTDAELADLCRPLKQPAAQIRYLQRLGVRVRRRPDGTPLVLKSDLSLVEHNHRENGPRWTR